MKTAMNSVCLNNSFFLRGHNLGQKLYASQDLGLVFDDKTNFLRVNSKGVVGLIPVQNISSMVPINQDEFFDEIQKVEPRKTQITHAQVLNIGHAQVSDPTRNIQNPRKELNK